jgi:hypothetical protein
LNRTVFPALTFTGSPVRGLSPLRAFVFTTRNVPKLRRVKPPEVLSSLTIAANQIGGGALCGYASRSEGFLKNGGEKGFGQDWIPFDWFGV